MFAMASNESTKERIKGVIDHFVQAMMDTSMMEKDIKDFNKIKDNIFVSIVSENDMKNEKTKLKSHRMTQHHHLGIFIDYKSCIIQLNDSFTKEWSISDDVIWGSAMMNSERFIKNDVTITQKMIKGRKMVLINHKMGDRLATNMRYIAKEASKYLKGDMVCVMPSRNMMVITEFTNESMLEMFGLGQWIADGKNGKTNFYEVSPYPFKLSPEGAVSDLSFKIPDNILSDNINEQIIGAFIIDMETGRKIRVNADDADTNKKGGDEE